MRVSRRHLLAGASAATAVALLPGCRSGAGSVVDVRSFGARGDGVTDDSQAIQAAVAALPVGTRVVVLICETHFLPRSDLEELFAS